MATVGPTMKVADWGGGMLPTGLRLRRGANTWLANGPGGKPVSPPQRSDVPLREALLSWRLPSGTREIRVKPVLRFAHASFTGPAVGSGASRYPRGAAVKGMIDWFARNGVAANLMTAFILLSGILAAVNSNEEVFPEMELDSISIEVAYLGAAPRRSRRR